MPVWFPIAALPDVTPKAWVSIEQLPVQKMLEHDTEHESKTISILSDPEWCKILSSLHLQDEQVTNLLDHLQCAANLAIDLYIHLSQLEFDSEFFNPPGTVERLEALGWDLSEDESDWKYMAEGI